MKKFISMVLAAAMVASLAPATAFAAVGTGRGDVTATAKILDADVLTKEEAKEPLKADPYPELQLKVTSGYSKTDTTDYKKFKQEVEVTLDKAYFTSEPRMGIRLDDAAGTDGGSFDANGKFVVRKAATASGTGSVTNAQVEAAEKEVVARAVQWIATGQTTLTNTVTLDSAEKLEKSWLDAIQDDGTGAPPAAVTAAPAKDYLEAVDTERTAKAALDAAIAAGTGAATEKAALDAAKAALATAESEVRVKEAAVTTAEAAVPAKETAVDTAVANKAALENKISTEGWGETKRPTAAELPPGVCGVAGTSTDGTDGKTIAVIRGEVDAALTTATNDLTAARDAVTAAEAAAKKAADDLATNRPALEKAIADAQKAFDAAAAAGSPTLKTNYDNAVLATAEKKPAYEKAKANYKAAWDNMVALKNAYNGGDETGDVTLGEELITIECIEWNSTGRDTGKNWARFVIYGKISTDDVLYMDLNAQMSKTGEGAKATVSVDSRTDMITTSEDLVFAQVKGKGLEISVKKLATVAEEEQVELDQNGLKLASVVGLFQGQEITLKLSKGFEFVDKPVYIDRTKDNRLTGVTFEGNEMTFVVPTQPSGADDGWDATKEKDDLWLYGIVIEATSAKSGAVGTITAKAKGYDSAAVEVIKVVDYKVDLTRDEDADLPVIYSGVNVDNYGITDDSDHWSVEVTAEETFPGAWSFRKGFNFELPEGIYVTDVDVIEVDGFLKTYDAAKGDAEEVSDGEVFKAFFDAYQEGSQVNFEFKKRVFDDVDAVLNKDEASMTFKLQLVADPTFEGDVILKLSGELVDDQEVAIAKFVKPYTVKAEQNDMKIDYRYTDIPTTVEITEAEAGLWAKNEAIFYFAPERADMIQFEDDPTFEIDSKSDLEIKEAKTKNGAIEFTVKTESDEAATVTIKDMQLFMQRNIPAGPYDLYVDSSLGQYWRDQELFAADYKECSDDGETITAKDHKYTGTSHDENCKVEDICAEDEFDYIAKEAFVNVITAGREVDDASFTTKVVVPVGESYIVAGEKQIELDTPAYINEAGYTMLPIRAVATALGINNNNVLWDQATKTVTILYGQRIITMSQGQKVVYVNGSAIPASAAVENTNSRTFLPMRDLATALGVTDITWDQATRTATLNGSQK